MFVVLFADDLQMGCTELRSKRYISDGFCTSVRPITEVVCAGECLPLQYLPNYAAYQKTWSREKTREWRCVDDVIRYRNVNLLCQNGEQRKYRIPTVKGCKCKRYNRRHNESDLPPNDSRQAISRPEPVSDDRRADRRASKRRNRNQWEETQQLTTPEELNCNQGLQQWDLKEDALICDSFLSSVFAYSVRYWYHLMHRAVLTASHILIDKGFAFLDLYRPSWYLHACVCLLFVWRRVLVYDVIVGLASKGISRRRSVRSNK